MVLQKMLICAVDMDGVGHNISHYDGVTYETRVEGTDYYVFRID
jgi:hypothetical protein